jgi:3-oxoacyl-[acyl-carrier protein] reductase
MNEQTFTKNQEIPKKERVIITVGTEGIGLAIANELAQENNDVAICARTQEKVDDAKKSKKFVSAYQLDLADRRAAQQFVQDSINDLGGLDVLVLNAAITGMTEDKEYVFKVNEVAQVALTRAAADELRKNNGRVVFLTSGAKNIEGAEAYGKSKKRIEEWLAEFSSRPENKGIQIFSINPGSCDTRMHKDVLEHGHGEVVDRTENIIREDGLRSPETIGKIITKMSLSGNKFNPESGEYDIPIGQCEVIAISNDNIKAEEEIING